MPEQVTGLDFDYYIDKLTADDYLQSAENGEPKAQFILGLCYFYGKGVEQDKEAAKAWFHKAAKQGHYFACWELGTLAKSASDYWHWRVQSLSREFEDDWDNPYTNDVWGGILVNIPDIYIESRSVGLDRMWQSDDCSLLFEGFDCADILPEDRVSLCAILSEECAMREDWLDNRDEDEDEDEEYDDCLLNIKSYIARLSSIDCVEDI